MRKVRVAIDACLSERLAGVLNALYGDHGFDFVHVNSLVPARTPDVVWADAFKKFGGRIVVSGDARIATRPHEAVAFIDNGFASFFPSASWHRLRGHEQAAVLVHAWPAIRRTAEETTGGACFRFPCDGVRGAVRLVDGPFTRLIIPERVLATTARRSTLA